MKTSASRYLSNRWVSSSFRHFWTLTKLSEGRTWRNRTYACLSSLRSCILSLRNTSSQHCPRDSTPYLFRSLVTLRGEITSLMKWAQSISTYSRHYSRGVSACLLRKLVKSISSSSHALQEWSPSTKKLSRNCSLPTSKATAWIQWSALSSTASCWRHWLSYRRWNKPNRFEFFLRPLLT